MKLKKLNRLLSGILCLCMLFSGIPIFEGFVVANAQEPVVTLPEVKNLIWEEKFEDSTLNGKWNSNGAVDAESQAFLLNASNKTATVYFDSDGTDSYTGVYALEIEFKKGATKDSDRSLMDFQIYGSNVSDGADVLLMDADCTRGERYDIYSYSRGINNELSTTGINATAGAFNKLTYLFNTTNSTVSVWVNDVLQIESKYAAADAAAGLKYLYIGMVSPDSNATISIDNIRFYESYPMTAAEGWDLDAAWLTKQFEGKLVDANDPSVEHEQISSNLTLPVTGDNKSTITWASSNTDVITNDGQVTCQDEATEVTMTAAITATGLDGSSKTVTKTFTFSVAAKVVETPVALPEVKTVFLEELFTGNVANGNWASSSFKNGKDELVDEVYRITRLSDDSTSGTRADLYFAQNKSGFKGTYGLDFTLKKIDTNKEDEVGEIKFRVAGDGGVLVNAEWKADGDLYLYYGDASAVGNNAYNIGKYNKESISLKYFFDTDASKFSMWIDGKNVVDSKYTYSDASQGVSYMRASLAAGQLISFELDDILFYETYPMTAAERLALDAEWLTKDKLVDANDPYLEVDQISCDLILPASGDNKTTITWASSNQEVISNAGQVVCADAITEVTMTATLAAAGADGSTGQTTKEFTFSVAAQKELTDAEAVAKVSEYLTVDVLSPLDKASNGIIRSLSLPTYNDLYGCSISWSSSNEAYITKSGRVIRPRYNEKDVVVTLTCTISRGEYQETKEYKFTVLADQEFVDPEYMSDEEFFGVWDAASNSWTTVGKFDYTYEGMETVGEIVKSIGVGGDYTAAKQALFEYFTEVRTQEAVMLPEESRNTLWADATIDRFQFIQNGKHCTGQGLIGNEWDWYTVDLRTRDLSASTSVAFQLHAWYNEDSAVEFYRSTAEDETKRPRLEMVVNGELKTYVASADAIIKPNNYADTSFSSNEYLEVYSYGDFLDDGHSRAIIKFDLPGIIKEDVVTEARLILYGKSNGADAEKKILVQYEPKANLISSETTWNTLKANGLVYSYNGYGESYEEDAGVDESGMWGIWDHQINNYRKQVTRFDCWKTIALEYKLTGDETYAYNAIRIMEGFIRDRGNWKGKVGSNVDDRADDDDPDALRGGYATTLTTSIRIPYWMDTLPVFLESEYATPDFLTATLKSIWDSTHYMKVYGTAKSGNWRQAENAAILDVSLRIPEFYDSTQGEDWFNYARNNLEELMFQSVFPDGSYQESADSYGGSVLENFTGLRNDLQALGTETSDAFNERLHNFAWYQAMLYGNDGANSQYGDSAATTRKVSRFEALYKMFHDTELEYVITFGESGEEPDWESICFYDSGVSSLRSDWSTNGIWLFTNVRGGGNHGHRDYNALTLQGYGRKLLIDSGYFVYDMSLESSVYGKSTLAHNTVVVNDTSQDSFYNAADQLKAYGTIHSFTTNDDYDYLEQSTPNNVGYEHRRSLTFIKSGLVIVSDLLTPNTEAALALDNNYKQVWHLPGDSNFVTSEEDMTIRSTWESGANIALAAAADEDVALETAMGWRAQVYGRDEEVPYAYYEFGGMGVQSLDTVIMLTEDDPTATVTAEKLETRENTTAMKFDMVTKNGSFTGYYLQSYDGEGGNFGPFTTDAHTAYVLLDAEGNVKEMLFNEGTYIRYIEGNINLVEATEEQESLFVELAGSVDYLAGSIVYLTGDEETIDSVKVLAQDDCLGIVVNDTSYTYDIVEGYITNIGVGASSTEENLPPLEIILEGTETSYQNGSDEDVSIHCTGDLEKLTGVQMDGADVDENNYTLTEGSTIVTFKAEYLDTLSVGEHTVTLLYTDSQVESKLEILAATGDNFDDNSTSTEGDNSDDDTTSTEGDNSDDDTISSEDRADEDDTTSTEQGDVEEILATQPASAQATAAPTGDNQNVLLWLVVLGVFGCGAIVMAMYIRKRKMF